ncbi:hypothetical protein ACIGHG_18355 [Bacillus sp. NPDC077411]|uniref:hypothetical protein n=1 Tax=Bacillus sp. NPDC077411 TaxID=3363947 RepID=UPI0037C76431
MHVGKIPGAFQNKLNGWRVQKQNFKRSLEEVHQSKELLNTMNDKTLELLGKDINEFNI